MHNGIKIEFYKNIHKTDLNRKELLEYSVCSIIFSQHDFMQIHIFNLHHKAISNQRRVIQSLRNIPRLSLTIRNVNFTNLIFIKLLTIFSSKYSCNSTNLEMSEIWVLRCENKI